MPGTIGRERLHARCVHRRIGKPEGGQRPEWRQDNPDRRWETVLHGRALLSLVAGIWGFQNGPQLHHDGTTPRALLGLIYARGALCDKCVNARGAPFLFRCPEGDLSCSAQCAPTRPSSPHIATACCRISDCRNLHGSKKTKGISRRSGRKVPAMELAYGHAGGQRETTKETGTV